MSSTDVIDAVVPMNAARGYVCAIVAALVYGVQYSPVKRYPVYDGLKFQWYMSGGIAFAGLAGAVLMNPRGADGCRLVSEGLVGGVLWGMSNVLVLPTVKYLGLGVGFAMYHSVNMAIGYAIGRFGLFGAPLEVAQNGELRDAGLVCLLLSLVVMINVEPEIVDLEDAAPAAPQFSPPIMTREHELAPKSSGEEARPAKELVFAPEAKRAERQGLLAAARNLGDAESGSLKPSRAISVGRIDELSTNRGNAPARAAYGSWRRGGNRGATTASDGAVGARGAVRLYQTKKRAASMWPLFEKHEGPSAVYSRYRGMISLNPQTRAAAASASEQRWRYVVGSVCGVGAGIICGTNMLPYVLYLAKRRGAAGGSAGALTAAETLSYFLSQCLGVFVVATLVLLAMTILAKVVGVEIKEPAIWPAVASGTLWATAFLLLSVSVADIGMAQAYTFDSIGPVMVSACISFADGEIIGLRNTILFATALVMQGLGVAAIAMG